MSDSWKQCEGQVADKNFPLHQFLGATDHSAVFLTQRGGAQPQKAAIKFIEAKPATADLQLSLWARAAQLSHPNLLRLFHSGRCRLTNKDLLYVVMEYAEEDLSQILPQRELTRNETREMLEPVLDVLVYLHGKKLAHSHLKPSNILATADQLKVSSDTLFPIGDARKLLRPSDIYDAPEAASSPLSTSAGDVWSLGVILVEALTQRPPALPLDNQANPIFPANLPQPFLDIVCHALLRDPKRRWTMGEIAARLNPASAAAAAGQAISPGAASPDPVSPAAVSPEAVVPAAAAAGASVAAGGIAVAVPLSPAPAIPAVKLPALRFDTPPPKPQPPYEQPMSARKQALVLPNYVVPVAAGLFVIVALLALPKILSRRPESSPSASTQPAAQPKPEPHPARRESAAAAKSATQNTSKTASTKKPAEQPLRSTATAPAPAVASLRTDTFPSANAPKSTSANPARGDVLDQVLPDVSEKARNTIRGTVRVAIRVHVDPAGNVTQAQLDSPGPSQYFADQALKAARRWEFTPPEINGRSVTSDWLIRFFFTPSGTKTIPQQTSP
jgi:TonB family protein